MVRLRSLPQSRSGLRWKLGRYDAGTRAELAARRQVENFTVGIRVRLWQCFRERGKLGVLYGGLLHNNLVDAADL